MLSLDFLRLHSSPLWWKGCLFLVLVQKVFIEPLNFSFFSVTGWGIDLDYCDPEWFALETNRSFCHFWDCIQVLHFRFFCWLWGLSISSMGFLPTAVDIIIIFVKLTHPVHFSSLIPQMSMFTLAISCLTTSNFPWFMNLTFQVLSNNVLYKIGLYFHHQSQSQLGIVFALAQPLHSFWSYFSTLFQ